MYYSVNRIIYAIKHFAKCLMMIFYWQITEQNFRKNELDLQGHYYITEIEFKTHLTDKILYPYKY